MLRELVERLDRYRAGWRLQRAGVGLEDIADALDAGHDAWVVGDEPVHFLEVAAG